MLTKMSTDNDGGTANQIYVMARVVEKSVRECHREEALGHIEYLVAELLYYDFLCTLLEALFQFLKHWHITRKFVLVGLPAHLLRLASALEVQMHVAGKRSLV